MTLSGFGIRTYCVLIDYENEGTLHQVEFGGVRATSVMAAKVQARAEFVEMLELPEDKISNVFAILTL